MAWTEPQFSSETVDWAGEMLIEEDTASLEEIRDLDKAREVVSNWRSSHSYPLNTIQVTLRNRSRRVDDDAIVAQRLKRMRSIKAKLQRLERLSLSDLQDIAGCRSVVSDIDDLNELHRLYREKDENIESEMVKRDDYVEDPQEDGYRSIHVVYSYRSTTDRYEVYNGLKVEIQLRSNLQHIWATATETVSSFTGQNLKTGEGTEDWFRFFALMSDVIARIEDCAPVPGTPDEVDQLVEEVRRYEQELNVRGRLAGWQTATRFIEGESVGGDWHLLMLDTERSVLHARSFSEKSRASEEYTNVEKETEDDPKKDAVLVSSESIESLRRAYPNYYVDLSGFHDLLSDTVEGNITALQ